MLHTRVTFRVAAGVSQLSTRVTGLRPTALKITSTPTTTKPTTFGAWTDHRRTYATPGKPKKGSIGASSPRAKRVVKKVASPTTEATAEEKKAATEKSQATAEKKKAAAEKKKAAEAAKKEKEKLKKAREKEKAAAKKAKSAAKKTTMTKANKEQSEEKKALHAKRQAAAKLKEQKQIALSPPKMCRSNAWLEYITERVPGLVEAQKGRTDSNVALAEYVKSISATFKLLEPKDLENYNHRANEKRAQAGLKYKAWVESYTPDQIRIANQTRSKLHAAIGKKGGRKWAQIKDERQLNRPMPVFIRFHVERYASGDFKNIALPDASRLVKEEWSKLDASQKQKYENDFAQAYEQYRKDYARVYGHELPSTSPSPEPEPIAS